MFILLLFDQLINCFLFFSMMKMYKLIYISWNNIFNQYFEKNVIAMINTSK